MLGIDGVKTLLCVCNPELCMCVVKSREPVALTNIISNHFFASCKAVLKRSLWYNVSSLDSVVGNVLNYNCGRWASLVGIPEMLYIERQLSSHSPLLYRGTVFISNIEAGVSYRERTFNNLNSNVRMVEVRVMTPLKNSSHHQP